MPRLTTLIPSPLVAVIFVTIFSVVTNSGVPTVGDRGELPSTLPSFGIPDVPFNYASSQFKSLEPKA